MRKIVLAVLLLTILFIASFALFTSCLMAESTQRKILYYRNPMNPQSTSPVPMKDSMGMDYVPVYEEGRPSKPSAVYISPEKQQLMDITTAKVQMRHLIHQIQTTSVVAYDPSLYTAQEEYLQALKASDRISQSTDTLLKEQVEGMIAAAEKKLNLMGMNKQEIEDLRKRSSPQGNLYLPDGENTVWIYATVYEADLAFVQEGQEVEIETVAFPGQTFKGKIVSITPVLDAMTRSAQARIEIENPGQKLKPQMSATTRISIDAGEKLAVPEEAVVDTGVKQVVFVAKEAGYFEPRQVTLGMKAGGFYEVLSGVQEGEEVVAAGNFFVDSESRLKLSE